MSWGIWIDLPEQVSWTRFLPLARPGIQDGQLSFLNAFRVSTTASAHLPSDLMWERAGPGALSRPPRATAERLVGHQKNAVFGRELVKFMLWKVSEREVSHVVQHWNISR